MFRFTFSRKIHFCFTETSSRWNISDMIANVDKRDNKMILRWNYGQIIRRFGWIHERVHSISITRVTILGNQPLPETTHLWKNDMVFICICKIDNCLAIWNLKERETLVQIEIKINMVCELKLRLVIEDAVRNMHCISIVFTDCLVV